MNVRTNANPAIVMWLIHFSFVIAIPIYGVILYAFLSPDLMSPRGGSGIPRPMLIAVLAALSVIQLALALGIGRWMRPEDAQVGAGAATAGGSAENYLRRRTVQLLISDALIEAIAIYGLIGFFLGLTMPQALAFMGVSLALLLARVALLRHWTDEYGRMKSGEGLGV